MYMCGFLIDERIDYYLLVMNEKIEASLLIVKCQVYYKVILFFEVRNHVVVKMNQQSFTGLLQDVLDHIRGDIVLLGNLFRDVGYLGEHHSGTNLVLEVVDSEAVQYERCVYALLLLADVYSSHCMWGERGRAGGGRREDMEGEGRGREEGGHGRGGGGREGGREGRGREGGGGEGSNTASLQS